MSEEKKEEMDDDLSALLDSALADFGKIRNTDDELDSIMAKMDDEAVQKAARNFDEIMQKTAQNFTASTSSMNEFQAFGDAPRDNRPLTAEEKKAAENFRNVMKALIEAEEKSRLNQKMETDVSDFEKVASDELFNRVKNLAEGGPTEFMDDSNWLSMMEFTKTIFAKDFMYPTVKQIHDNFLEYMTKHPELEDDLKQKYEKQIDAMSRICKIYEKETPDGDDVMSNRTEEICNLIMELQSCGYPPEEVVGSMPDGWSIDHSTGFPHVDDVSRAADACCLM